MLVKLLLSYTNLQITLRSITIFFPQALIIRIWIHIYFCGTVPLKDLCKLFKNWLSSPGVISNSPGYNTPRRLTPRSMIPWGDWLRAVWYLGEIDSAQYDTSGRLTPCSMIPWRDWLAGAGVPGIIPGGDLVGLSFNWTLKNFKNKQLTNINKF